jgi:hypothetical protein
MYADYWTSIIVDKDQYKNIHWDPQTDFCGLKKFHPLFNFVGEFIQMHAYACKPLQLLEVYFDVKCIILV